MKKSFALLFALFFVLIITTPGSPASDVSAAQGSAVYVDFDITQDTVWPGNNTYYICSTGNKEPMVLNGATLTIEEGAVVYFADGLSGDLPGTGKRPYESFTVESGNLIAKGVKFSVVPGRENRGWAQVELRGEPGRANNATFTDCTFEYSGFFGAGCAIYAVDKTYKGGEQEVNLTVTGCTFGKASPGSSGVVYDNGYHLENTGKLVVENCVFNGFGRGVQVLRNSQDDVDISVNACTFNDSTLRSVEIMDGRLASVTNNVFNNNNKDEHSIVMLYDYNDSNHPKEVVLKDNTFNGPAQRYPMMVHASSQINKDEDFTNNYSDDFPEEFRFVELFGNVGPPGWAEFTESAIWGNVGVPYIATNSLAITRVDNMRYSDLVIRPGVTVCLGADVNLNVEGTLKAIGSEELPVTIRRHSFGEPCGQIQLSHFKGQLEMKHCVIDGLFRGAWLEIDDDNLNETLVLIDSCVFRNSTDCQMIIRGNYTQKGKIIIKNSVIEGDHATGNNGIVLDGARRVYLLNDLIHGCPANGIVFDNSPYYNENETALFIENCTIADNAICGVLFKLNSPFNAELTEYGASVKNSIIAGNGLMNVGVIGENRNDRQIEISYSLIEKDDVEFDSGIYEHTDGTRFIELPAAACTECLDAAPLFADPDNSDYHLKSKKGRWSDKQWIRDRETSPAVDTGDPSSDFSLEPAPNGKRINMGYYGNTMFASKSAASFLSGSGWLWLLLLFLVIAVAVIVVWTERRRKMKNKNNAAMIAVILAVALFSSGCTITFGNPSADTSQTSVPQSTQQSGQQSTQESAQVSSQAAGQKIPLNEQAAPVIIAELGAVSTADFSIDLPKGWAYETNPSNLEFGIIAYDPQKPERRLFYYYMFNPFMKSMEARDYFLSAYGPGNIYASCPVLDPPEVTEFFYKWNEYIDWLGSQGLKAVTMKFDELNIVERYDLQNFFSAYALDNAVVRAHTKLEGSEIFCEGLFSASVISLIEYDVNGVDFAPLNVYNVMGIMAPADEFVQIQDILNQSLTSFTLSQSYADEYVRSSQEATRIMTESWKKRQKSYDVISQKVSDATLGYERLYDSETGEIYRVDSDWYSLYDENRSQFSNSNLYPFEANDERYGESVDYYIYD